MCVMPLRGNGKGVGRGEGAREGIRNMCLWRRKKGEWEEERLHPQKLQRTPQVDRQAHRPLQEASGHWPARGAACCAQEAPGGPTLLRVFRQKKPKAVALLGWVSEPSVGQDRTCPSTFPAPTPQ